jgi:hypothetical protein
MLSYKPTRRRSLGCPKERWISQILVATIDESPITQSGRKGRLDNAVNILAIQNLIF